LHTRRARPPGNNIAVCLRAGVRRACRQRVLVRCATVPIAAAAAAAASDADATQPY